MLRSWVSAHKRHLPVAVRAISCIECDMMLQKALISCTEEHGGRGLQPIETRALPTKNKIGDQIQGLSRGGKGQRDSRHAQPPPNKKKGKSMMVRCHLTGSRRQVQRGISSCQEKSRGPKTSEAKKKMCKMGFKRHLACKVKQPHGRAHALPVDIGKLPQGLLLRVTQHQMLRTLASIAFPHSPVLLTITCFGTMLEHGREEVDRH